MTELVRVQRDYEPPRSYRLFVIIPQKKQYSKHIFIMLQNIVQFMNSNDRRTRFGVIEINAIIVVVNNVCGRKV